MEWPIEVEIKASFSSSKLLFLLNDYATSAIRGPIPHIGVTSICFFCIASLNSGVSRVMKNNHYSCMMKNEQMLVAGRDNEPYFPLPDFKLSRCIFLFHLLLYCLHRDLLEILFP